MSEDITEKVKTLFEQVASRYDNPSMRFFPFCGDRLITHLRPKPGSRLLDIATGTGAVALPAAQAIAPGGRVQAIDLAENMLDIAAANLQRAGMHNVDFHVMDASRLDFKSNYFDTITCSYGIFFLPDMLAALKEWRRVLKPGGRIMFTSFAATAFHPLALQFRNDLKEFGVEIPEASWMRLSNQDECLQLVLDAGLENPQLVEEQLGYHLNGVDDWWEIILSSGFRSFLAQLENNQTEEFRNYHLNNLQQYLSDKGLWLDVATLFVSGQRRVE